MLRSIVCLVFFVFLTAIAIAQGGGTFSLAYGGLQRTYVVHVPPTYESGKPAPLILLLHGRFGTGEKTLGYTKIRRLANQYGLIVVAPNGYRKSWNDGRGDTPAHRKGVDDVGFLNALLDYAMKTYSVDSQRVYCTGMSNGGFMTMTLMARSGHRFAGAAIVTASVPELGAADFLPNPALPVLILNGTADPLVKYDGGPIRKGDNEMILATPRLAELYAERCGCTGKIAAPGPNPAEDGTVTEVITWQGCQAGTAVELWTVKGGGHTWPGKEQYLSESIIGKTSRDFDGTEVILDFLLRHQRRN